MFIHTYIHTYVRTYVCMYVRMFVCMYVCTYVCMYVYTAFYILGMLCVCSCDLPIHSPKVYCIIRAYIAYYNNMWPIPYGVLQRRGEEGAWGFS